MLVYELCKIELESIRRRLVERLGFDHVLTVNEITVVCGDNPSVGHLMETGYKQFHRMTNSL